jgi:hypothetical protein
LQRAASLDPLVASPRVAAGLEYFMARDYDEVLRVFTEASNLHTETIIVHGFIGLTWAGLNRMVHGGPG